MQFHPIGVIHTPHHQAAGAPIQPCRAVGVPGTAVIDEPYVEGLADLVGFDRIWLLFWCHRASEPKMTVIPYRDTRPRGLFATRAPARPNPIGLSCVRLQRIEGNTLHLLDVDLLDNTPLLDIKPYVPQYDVYPVQNCGWVDHAPDPHPTADARFEKSDSD